MSASHRLKETLFYSRKGEIPAGARTEQDCGLDALKKKTKLKNTTPHCPTLVEPQMLQEWLYDSATMLRTILKS
jgi:hypothetical protein